LSIFGIINGTAGTAQTVTLGATGVQVELGSTATAYQKTVSIYDTTEAGVDSLYYLEFDGVDDKVNTASVDLSGTYQLFVSTAATIVSGLGGFAEFLGNGAANAAGTQGRFASYTPAADAVSSRFDFGGVAAAALSTITTSNGTTNIISRVLDSQNSPYQVIRKDGSVAATSTTDVGGQPFANAPIYLCDNTSGVGGGPAAVNVYQVVILGRTATAGEITNVEAYLADKSGVVL
jgi:hypothetical protein